jgi:hypothetical protein
MAFTDDDMQKLENGYWFQRVPIMNVGQSESWVWCDGDKIVELLGRLKAAENAIAHSHGLASKWCCDKAIELDKDWRRAAGKGG